MLQRERDTTQEEVERTEVAPARGSLETWIEQRAAELQSKSNDEEKEPDKAKAIGEEQEDDEEEKQEAVLLSPEELRGYRKKREFGKHPVGDFPVRCPS